MKISALVILVIFNLSVAQASIISGTQFTGDGKEVNLGGLEWLSLDATAGYSRTSIENGTAGSWLSDGWRYSTRIETEDLLDSLWGGTTESWSKDNFDGASWFGDNFSWLSSFPSSIGTTLETHFFFGNPKECLIGPANSCIGSVRLDYNPLSSQPSSSLGFFQDGFGLSVGLDGLNEADAASPNTRQYNQGSMLVRAVSVPEPPAIYLAVLGFIGLFISRKFSRQN